MLPNRDKPAEQRQFLRKYTECIDSESLQEIFAKINFDQDNEDSGEVVDELLDELLTTESFDLQKISSKQKLSI